ncbi:MAG: hypothetical protein AAFP20_23620 [Cyanobacteria bacterium J06614_10]
MIRKYKPGDEQTIGQIYYDAVHQLTCDDYTEEQRNAWATQLRVTTCGLRNGERDAIANNLGSQL